MALYNWILPEFRSLVLNFLEYKPKEFGFILPFHRIESFILHPLSDFEPKGNVANNYGAYRKQDGVAERVLFVIDSDGIILLSYISPKGINPRADGILTALESIPREAEHKK